MHNSLTMADLEKKDIEIAAWQSWAEKTDYSETLKWLSDKEILWNEESDKAKKQAEELLNQIPWTEQRWEKNVTDIQKEKSTQLPPWYDKAIDQRTTDPKVREGIKSSILNTMDVINNKSIDKDENRIARQIGKVMNALFPKPKQ